MHATDPDARGPDAEQPLAGERLAVARGPASLEMAAWLLGELGGAVARSDVSEPADLGFTGAREVAVSA
ncbi:MAG TPA: hypothetical protein VFA70_05975, partial [Dehalococcoidia bacterium]|nr:hypothetical protein [Dehalococcoidia bacterium]